MSYQVSQSSILDFAQFLGARTRERGSELVFQYCPYCRGGDRRDQWSFSINMETGLFCCQRGGCGERGGFGKLCKDFDFRARDDPELQKQRDNLEADYTYKDLDGQPVLRKRKWRRPDGSKYFRWQHMEAGCWKSGADKVKMLYGLPSLRSRPPAVYLAEGEKDADTVTGELGYPCLSLPDGAREETLIWNDCYDQHFAGKTVYILPDNDKIGLKYGRLQAAKIAGLADTKVYLLDLAKIWQEIPAKGDVSDMVAALGVEETKRRLADLISSTEPWTADADLKTESVFDSFGFYSVPDLTEEERRPPEFIIEGMLPVGMTFLSGAPKTRKSFLALQIAIAVASGKPFFGRKTVKCDVAYFDLEGSKSRVSSRTQHMTTAIPPNVFVTNCVKERLSNGLTDKLRDLHRQRPEIRLVVIDTYSRARGVPKSFGQNAYDADVAFLEPVQQMALEEQVGILFVHHDRKGAGFSSDSFERLSGTMGISGSADAVLNLITEGKRFEGKAKLEFTPRDAKGGELNLVFSDRFAEWQLCEEQRPDIKGSPICNWIISNPPEPRTTGDFIAYDDLFYRAYHSYSDKPGDRVRELLEPWRGELVNAYGLGVQTGVKYNGKRGIRVVNLL